MTTKTCQTRPVSSAKMWLLLVVVQEEKNAIVGMEFDQLAEFHHGTRVIDVCWSTLTDLHGIPRSLAYVTLTQQFIYM